MGLGHEKVPLDELMRKKKKRKGRKKGRRWWMRLQMMACCVSGSKVDSSTSSVSTQNGITEALCPFSFFVILTSNWRLDCLFDWCGFGLGSV